MLSSITFLIVLTFFCQSILWAHHIEAYFLRAMSLAERDWPRPNDVTPDKRVVMGISGGEAPGVNNYFAQMPKKLAPFGYSVEMQNNGLKTMAGSQGQAAENRAWISPWVADEIDGMPGVKAGTSRVKLTDLTRLQLIRNLSSHAKTWIFIGGNDHLGESQKIGKLIAELLQKMETSGLDEITREGITIKKEDIEDVVVAALPKTIDRDTYNVYPIGSDSAGRASHNFVLRAAALPGSNSCTVFQMMGQDMGALTLSAGDMNPDDLSGYSEAERKKMKLIAPTTMLALPEWSVEMEGESVKTVVVSLSDIILLVKKSMKKYGAANLVMSEGFNVVYTIDTKDPVFDMVIKNNSLLKARFDRLKKDEHGHPKISDLGIADFVAEALSMEQELGLTRGVNLFFEDPGYSSRAGEVSELDSAVAEAATDLLAFVTTDPARRREVARLGGVCIGADVGVRTVEDVRKTMKVRPLSEVTGMVNLADSGIYSDGELRGKNIIGYPNSYLGQFPAIPTPERETEPFGYSLRTTINAINSQTESARDMGRGNVCVIAREDADDIVSLLGSPYRGMISRADAYVRERTWGGLATVSSMTKLSLTEIVDMLKRIYQEKGFFNLVIAENFPVREEDELLGELRKDEVGEALIEGAVSDGRGNLIFGRRTVDLLILALGAAEGMPGIRKNILGKSLNLLPGEKTPYDVGADYLIRAPIEAGSVKLQDLAPAFLSNI